MDTEDDDFGTTKDCAECHTPMSLNDGMEWPEDPVYCWGCMYHKLAAAEKRGPDGVNLLLSAALVKLWDVQRNPKPKIQNPKSGA